MAHCVLLVREIYLSVIGSVDGGSITCGAYASIAWLAANITLSVKSWKLRLVLYEIILAILEDSSLIVKTSEHAHALTLWLRIFISIFHLFFTMLNVTWSDWLNILMKWTTQYCFDIFNVETCALATMTLRWSTLAFVTGETVYEILIQLVTIWIWLLISSTLIIKILLKLFISQIETSPIRHVHHETARSKALSLLLLDASDLLFWMTHRSIVFLRLLLHYLILNKLLIHLKFLSVTCDSWLTWINWSLNSRNHV